MNEYFKSKVRECGKSLYRISHETGIPYTVLNEIYNEKKNINNITSETVYKLCLYFDCDMKSLLNPFPLLKNSRGIYRKVSYQWVATNNGEEMELQILADNEPETIITLKRAIPDAYKEYNSLVAEVAIDDYLKRKKDEEVLNGAVLFNA